MKSQLIKSACRMCRRACGIDVHLRNGKIVEVKGSAENPASSGVLCSKGRAVIDYIYSSSRIKSPLKKDGDTWKTIGWDEALDIIATKLQKIKQEHGAKAVAAFIGESASQCDAAFYVRRFLDVYGSPNLFTGGSLCFRPIPIACRLTFGKTLVAEPENSRCIVIWGANPYHSNRQQAAQILKSRKAGAKLVVIDPRRTFFAQKADVHLQPRPGSDCILALAMLNVIVTEGLYDREFVAKWTTGFDKLQDHVADYTPDKVEELTWVPGDAIREAARLFATTRPASIIVCSGLYHQPCGVQSLRAISILQAITGNIEVAGGWIAPVELHLSNMALSERLTERHPLGEDKYPLFVAYSRRLEGQVAVLTDTLLTGKPYPIKALFIAGGNPALSWPDTAKVRAALPKLDFLVVMDIRMTETAQLADIVLPAATFMETTELHTYAESGLPYAVLRKKATEFSESLPDWKFWLKLANKMGYQEHFPWSNEEEVIDFLLKPSGITLEQLKQNPAGIAYGVKQYGTYQQKGFPTPSGKIELYSSKLLELGHPPLPACQWQEDNESIAAEKYPLLLITGVRHLEYTHSQFRDVPSLRKKVSEPMAEVHPTTAQRYGVADKQMIYIETAQGKIEIKAKVTEDIMPEVVSIPFGWAESNANILTDWQNPDPISGLPALVGLPCKIGAINKKAKKEK